MQLLAFTPAEFFARWPSPPGPLTEQLLHRGADAVILALFDAAGTLHGYWPIWQAVHVDGVWLDPALKGAPEGPAALRSLLDAAFATLQANGVSLAFAVLADDAESLAQAARLGFVRAPGNLYTLKV